MDAHPTGFADRPAALNIGDGQRIRETVLGLDAWFDTMRQPGGYGGPVVHWWGDSLSYTGAGLDWRYEGIIYGYLQLWEATSQARWLLKARRAGNDLAAGQLPNGNFRNSEFEINPGTGGTPHEAACDSALLYLAAVLRQQGDPTWEDYYLIAKRNIVQYYIGRLWDVDQQYFRDDPNLVTFVPNKSATLVEALFALTELTGEDLWVRRYAIPTLQAILAHQVVDGILSGAIYQNSFGPKKIAKFFPYYIARCIPALIKGWDWSGDERFAESAYRAGAFILRWQDEQGSYPQVVYPNNRLNPYPRWIAGIGDILRALNLARRVNLTYDDQRSLEWLLSGRRPDGGICTAWGFGRVAPSGGQDDPRDEISVCGWADKAFRYLSILYQPEF